MKQLPNYPEPFFTKFEAINRAKELKKLEYECCVLKSIPTEAGESYYVEPLDTLIRANEKVLYRSHK